MKKTTTYKYYYINIIFFANISVQICKFNFNNPKQHALFHWSGHNLHIYIFTYLNIYSQNDTNKKNSIPICCCY